MTVTGPNILDATEEFMARANQPLGVLKDADAVTNLDTRTLRVDLMREEFREYAVAEGEGDPVEIADGLLDIIVIAWGTLLSYFGAAATELMAREVWTSNLSKVDGSFGPTQYREDGKVIKPEGWEPPDIAGVLRDAGFLD